MNYFQIRQNCSHLGDYAIIIILLSSFDSPLLKQLLFYKFGIPSGIPYSLKAPDTRYRYTLEYTSNERSFLWYIVQQGWIKFLPHKDENVNRAGRCGLSAQVLQSIFSPTK